MITRVLSISNDWQLWSFFGENFLGEKVLLDFLSVLLQSESWKHKLMLGEEVESWKGAGLLQWARCLIEPSRPQCCWQGVVSTQIEFSAEVGRGAGHWAGPPKPHRHREKLVVVRSCLAAGLANRQLKHPFHLGGGDISQAWRRRWGVFWPSKQISLISSGSASVFLCTEVNLQIWLLQRWSL